MLINPGVYHRSLHIHDNQLVPFDPECPFCGSTKRQTVSLLQVTPKVYLLKCSHCYGASASRVPKAKVLTDYYSGYYNSATQVDSVENVTFGRTNRLGKYLAGKFSPYLSKSHVSILDYGGGDGSISYDAAVNLLGKNVQKVDITVVDYNVETIEPQDKRISIIRKDKLEDLSSSYNIVIASAVIEHIPNPRIVLDCLLKCIQHGGVIYFRTPYVVPLIKLFSFVGLKWDFTYPGHIHDLGQDFWETYFTKIIPNEGFQVLHSKPSIVKSTFRKSLLRTLAAYSLKAPWYILGSFYGLVGGWEIIVLKEVVGDEIIF